MFDAILSLFMLVYLGGPIVWLGRNLLAQGGGALHPANLPNTFSHLLYMAPGIGWVYAQATGHMVWAVILFVVYAWMSWGTWAAIIADVRMGGSGAGAGDENVRRGSRVVEAAELDAQLNRSRRDDEPIVIGGVRIPRELEAQHFLVTGTTGTGKTQIINAMLRTIRKRGQRAIIADPGGGFYSRFAQPGDKLFNPFDRRTVDWSPFAEIRADYDCDRIAKAIVPDGTGDGAEWHHYAQTLIAQAMLAMHRRGERSIKRLLYWMTTADQKELGTLLEGSPAAVLCAKGNDKMLASTRGIISTYLGVFPYLADEGQFSIRDFIRDWREGWLYITYRDDQMGLLRHLVATLLELGIVEGLSLSEDQERGLWFVMDEVDSLGKVTSLRAGLTKLRKYGGRLILGLQTIAQLRTTYGRDEAQTLIANTTTKAVLRAGDAETAKSMEHELGEQEIEREQGNTSISTSDHGQSQSMSTSTQVVRQSAVLASEITGLPNLHGYLKVPGDEIARITVPYVSMPEVTPAFE